MISVILYGRNDSYGYNLHKRAAISLNCMAEVLTHPGDEIIFVDCNTPDDLSTFPEAIQDTLTQRAKRLLRILRLRPGLYEKYKRGSPLMILEPLCRNVAIRRSNPDNRWILSTNTDMVFIPRPPGQSLSDVVAQLPDGFYELPRFEVPETLWESVKRTDPIAILAAFERWGRSLHLNEAILGRQEILYDGPGDFQLMLRDQIFAIQGFNEEMTKGWHVDANLCKRFYLLNGKVDSLLDQVFAYHCDHTRQATVVHRYDQPQNDQNRFFHRVSSPYLSEQAQTWGLPHEEIEETRLTDEHVERFACVLETMLPGLSVPVTEDVMNEDSFNHGLLYDNFHVLPFIADHLVALSPTADVGYLGGNGELLRLVAEFRGSLGHTGHILCDKALLTQANPNGMTSLSVRCIPMRLKQIFEQSSVFIFDAAMMGFPQTVNSAGITVPAPDEAVVQYAKQLFSVFLAFAKYEKTRIQGGKGPLRKFLFIGSQNTWFEPAVSQLVEMVLAPYSGHVRYGYVRKDAFTKPLDWPPIYTLLEGDNLSKCERLARELSRPISEAEYCAAEGRVAAVFIALRNPDTFPQVVLHIGLTDLDLALVRLKMRIADLSGQSQDAEVLRKLLSVLEQIYAQGTEGTIGPMAAEDLSDNLEKILGKPFVSINAEQ